MRILVTGAGGQLGHEVVQEARRRGHDVSGLTREQLDVTDQDAVAAVVGGLDLVVNCAAYTAVDRAQEEPDRAYAVNFEGARNLATYAKKLVHFSTDYVFDGRKGAPYTEADATHPLNVYGASKLAGEEAVLALGRHVVIRTSWLFGAHGHNFVKAILKQAHASAPLRVVDDQTGCPTAAVHLASVALDPREPGLYHYCDTPPTTWYDFSRAILKRHGLDHPVTPIGSEGLPTPRPAYSVLACRIPQKSWLDALF